jgi:putative transposase
MKQSKFTDEQIIGLLKQADAGMSVKELCRSGGLCQPTFYDSHSRFGSTEPSDAAKLRELEAENNKLKKLLAEAHLDIHALKSVFSVKR